MKTLLFRIFLCLMLLTQAAWSQTFVWTQKANLPGTTRSGAASFSINNKGYVVAGLKQNPTAAISELWQWNQVNNTWTQKANLPAAGRYSASGFSIGTKGYIAVGWTWSPAIGLKDLWEYNSTTNSWLKKTDFPGGARYTASSFVISGIAYLGMGYSPLENDLWAYDPGADAWTQKADLPSTGRQSAAGFAVGGKGYIACGSGGGSLKQLWRYDPVANSWLQRADFPGVARYGCQAFAFNGNAYVGGGYTGLTHLTDYYQYNPANNQWTAVAVLPASGRSTACCFAINGKGYMSCGTSSVFYLNDLWEFAPAPLTVTANATNVSCYGGSDGSATAIATGPAPITYYWSTGQTTSIATNLPAGTYTVTVTSSGGFTATASVLIIQPPPIVVSVLNPNAVCKGQQVSLIAQANGGTPPFYYNWDNGLFIGAVYTFTPSSSSIHTLVVTDANGCLATQNVYVQVYQLPSAPITASNSGIACIPDSVKLSTNPVTTLSYQWKKNGNNISGAVDSVYYAKVSGTYKVRVINQHGCSRLSSPQTVTISNCRTAGVDESPMVYPNPSHDRFTINLETMDEGLITLTVYDIAGRVISRYEGLSNKSSFTTGDDLVPGTYFVRLEQSTKTRNYTILKTE